MEEKKLSKGKYITILVLCIVISIVAGYYDGNKKNNEKVDTIREEIEEIEEATMDEEKDTKSIIWQSFESIFLCGNDDEMYCDIRDILIKYSTDESEIDSLCNTMREISNLGWSIDVHGVSESENAYYVFYSLLDGDEEEYLLKLIRDNTGRISGYKNYTKNEEVQYE